MVEKGIESQGKVFFSSTQIAQKQKPQYFQRIKKKAQINQKALISSIVGIAGTFLIIAAIVLILVLAKKPSHEQLLEDSPWQQEVVATLIQKTESSENPKAYPEAKQQILKLIDKTKDRNAKFELEIEYSKFLSYFSNADEALQFLLEIRESELTSQQQITLADSIASVYSELEDQENSEKYLQKSLRLYKELHD